MTKIAKQIFKAYDIRGIVETELTPATTKLIGQAIGSSAIEQQIKAIVVGYDGRLTSPILAKNLIAGILSTGCDVYEIGQVSTPMVYFANYHLKTYSGVMITGSHNPPEYNGLKMVLGGETLSGEKIQALLQRIEKKQFVEGNGIHYVENITEAYLNEVTSGIKLNRKLSVVVDAGNGVAGKVAPTLFRRMGCSVLGLYCKVDGTFPNHHPDPSKVENLADLIHALKVTGAEIGLAFDGDGDRLGVVTKDGNVIFPDRQMMLFAADILSKNKNAKIIYDVKSSRLLAEWIKDNGGQAIMCRTGHSFVKAKIKETGALLAGEMSGHLFFNDRWYGCDDGIYAGARLLEILSQVENPSELLNALPNCTSTPEINLDVEVEGKQHKIIEELQKTAKFDGASEIITIDGLRVEYEDGFGLVRASNTTPVLVLRFEANTASGLKRIQDQFKNILKQHVKNITF
ncbi:MAG: phosphomannomutase/phosphoglucomutase [Neisseriaceae bacterium]|nr:MAG: phosphomannomutase/phosphoglucomutase [Neisseriaceae bacterium]